MRSPWAEGENTETRTTIHVTARSQTAPERRTPGCFLAVLKPIAAIPRSSHTGIYNYTQFRRQSPSAARGDDCLHSVHHIALRGPNWRWKWLETSYFQSSA